MFTKSSLNQLLFNHLVNNIHLKRDNQGDGFRLASMNLLRILTIQKLWDFNFLCGLVLDLLDGFLIGRFEGKLESFDLFAAKFESGAERFSGGKLLWCWSPFKTRIPLLFFYY